MLRRLSRLFWPLLPFLALTAPVTATAREGQEERSWLAGDHHVHSEYSVGWQTNADDPKAYPTPIKGGDARYSILRNARMARQHGLAWMVSTDHGGPGHDRVNADMAYPDLIAARRAVPDMLLFYGMEFDTPGGEHSSLIMPRTDDERDRLRAIEAGYDERNAHPTDASRDTKAKMVEALRFMAAFPVPPVLIANHPSRTASGPGQWGLHAPEEFRAWQDAAPRVAIGMEGAPGHQAARLGNERHGGPRGLYRQSPTLGGFDQMVATLGGAWDAMLGEGRRWWITATSDSHINWRDGGADFWPGEYSKTYVEAARSYDGVLEGLRAGRVFAVTGDLISGVALRIGQGEEQPRALALGEERIVRAGEPLTIEIELNVPDRPNAGGKKPVLHHVDLIIGEVKKGVSLGDANPSTRLLHRFTPRQWRRQGERLHLRHFMDAPEGPLYLRLRGTSSQEAEPLPDEAEENPWSDLWFYTNPIWLTPARP